MRKLLVSLCALGSFSMAFATFLPNGNYAGYLKSNKGTVDNADTNKTTIMNDQANVVIPHLTDINASNGLLTGSIVNMNQGGADCFGGAAKFSAVSLGMRISASNVTITNCTFDGQKTFSGSYSATVPIFGVQAGTTLN